MVLIWTNILKFMLASTWLNSNSQASQSLHIRLDAIGFVFLIFEVVFRSIVTIEQCLYYAFKRIKGQGQRLSRFARNYDVPFGRPIPS
jgi:hypothetical protein